MVCYPQVQKEAQAELDKVLDGRLPKHSDIASLPYLSALVKEVYRYAAVSFEYSLLPVKCVSRWQPVGPLGRPLFISNIVTSWHPCFVKASHICRPTMISTTTIISPPTLLWSPTSGDNHLRHWTFLISQTLLHRAMLNDERDYPEPHEFRPERFLKNGRLDSSVRDPMDIAFGFGRRWALFILFISPSHLLMSSPF